MLNRLSVMIFLCNFKHFTVSFFLFYMPVSNADKTYLS